MDNCIFCKIIAKQIPSSILYEDEDVLAFKDISPVAPVHFLIVPKLHIPTLAELKPEHAHLIATMMQLASKLAAEQGCAYVPDIDGKKGTGGFKAQFNVGPDGGQVVYHLHLHVIGGKKFSS